MILVLSDDLLFRSKISTTAKAVGVVVRAATTRAAALERLAEERPTLVLFDLDSARVEPFAVLEALRANADWQSVPTLGFVSHVHTDLITRARALGIDQVMARGAFANALPQILRPHAQPVG